MKKTMLCGILTAVFFFFSNVSAQDSLSVIGKFIDGHPWTMDFAITSNFTLSSFQGAAISVSKFTSDYQSIRVGISTNSFSASDDNSGSNYNSDTITNRSSGTSGADNYSLQVTIQRLTYASPNAHTSMYFAIGPLAGIGWRKLSNSSNNSSVNGAQNQQTNSANEMMYAVGALGSIGVEWFWSEHITVHAEYGLAASYNWGRRESNDSFQSTYPGSPPYSTKSSNSSSASFWSFTGQRVLFGLSVNF